MSSNPPALIPIFTCLINVSFNPTDSIPFTSSEAFMSFFFFSFSSSSSLRPFVNATSRTQPFGLSPSQVHCRSRGVAVASHLISPVATSLSWKAGYSHAASEMETVDTSTRLAELRKLMKERNIDIYGQRSPFTSSVVKPPRRPLTMFWV